MLKDKTLPTAAKKQSLLKFDRVLGLDLSSAKKPEIPVEIKKLAAARQQYREQKNWAKADELRRELEARGYLVKDIKEGFIIKPKK